MPIKQLDRSFYLRPTIRVARDLLGKLLIRRSGGERLAGRIVEVEAYLGEKDAASHAYRGRTQRNEVMFREGGYLYVYFTYGMHYCCNVVTEGEGKGRAVLLRGIEPVEGIETMRRFRDFRGKKKDDRDLTNGPAKLCEAFGIARAENGLDLTAGDIILATDGNAVARSMIAASPRIGISEGTEHEWRFYIKGNLFVSR
jgi:DNA-3-methyladenine glycosylase